MRKSITALLLLIASSAHAGGQSTIFGKEYLTVFAYKNPSKRVNEDPLQEGDLSKINIYEVDCNQPDLMVQEVGEFTHNLEIGGTIKNLYLFSYTPVMCVKMTATDSDGLTSDYSGVFKGFDFRTPKPTECVQ